MSVRCPPTRKAHGRPSWPDEVPSFPQTCYLELRTILYVGLYVVASPLREMPSRWDRWGLQQLLLFVVLAVAAARDPKCDRICDVPVERGGCKCDNNCDCLRELLYQTGAVGDAGVVSADST